MMNQAIPVMSAVADSMTGSSAPILADGPTSAIGRIVGRMGCDTSRKGVQDASRELLDMGILVIDRGTLRLDITSARALVHEMLCRVNHPAHKEHPLRDMLQALMERLSAAVSGLTKATMHVQPAS